MMKKVCLAAAAVALLSSGALAQEYYVVQEKATKCLLSVLTSHRSVPTDAGLHMRGSGAPMSRLASPRRYGYRR